MVVFDISNVKERLRRLQSGDDRAKQRTGGAEAEMTGYRYPRAGWPGSPVST
ncbi:hypothetical protein P7K49_027553, partial [Saguinus oedipus]